ncbi:hypothetical protein XBP1_10025 [Xenorhabdus bovienii str. puntauvense]|uniref:Uncharacterized protein n=2 Tax=Xenorhabdus bovienii TaxID=40576 RepID=A0A0B6XC19_XENBV|nr:hypothetical protein XBP1_10025 [Xenorhabdus bovienii str. puntauvense]CDM90721.1 protein of unknown function [Xenorhabdus bovienii]
MMKVLIVEKKIIDFFQFSGYVDLSQHYEPATIQKKASTFLAG